MCLLNSVYRLKVSIVLLMKSGVDSWGIQLRAQEVFQPNAAGCVVAVILNALMEVECALKTVIQASFKMGLFFFQSQVEFDCTLSSIPPSLLA